MLTGIFIGLVIGIVLSIFIFIVGDLDCDYEGWQCLLICLVIVLFVVIFCGVIGLIIDICHQTEYIATWETTRSSYEQAMNVYDNYESMVKDNPDLIKDAIAKNEELARMKHQATRWWNWHLNDDIANLAPIKIGTN